MTDERTSDPRAAHAWAFVEEINRAWLDGNLDRLTDLLHPDVVMALPGFAERVVGREAMRAGFEDFVTTCTVRAWELKDPHVSVIDRTAVASFLFELVYERNGERFRSTGRDLWVLQSEGDSWRAVFRALLDLTDVALGKGSTASSST